VLTYCIRFHPGRVTMALRIVTSYYEYFTNRYAYVTYYYVYSYVLFTICGKVYFIFSCYQEVIEVTSLHIYCTISTSSQVLLLLHQTLLQAGRLPSSASVEEYLVAAGPLPLPSGLVQGTVVEIVDITAICFSHTSCSLLMSVLLSNDDTDLQDFYPRDAMLARVFATATCLSVCLSHAGIVPSRAKAGS